jgi:hypothetical protein
VFSRRVPGAITVERLYDRIARDTGGTVVPISSGANLATTFRRVLDNFRASYVLYFTPEGVERAGAHRLDVRVRRSNVQVRARSGYVWP